MDGSLLSNSIYSLKGIDLRIIYSLLTNMNLKKLIAFNINKFASNKHNKYYVTYIFEKAREFDHLSDAEIQVSLFQEINRTLALEGNYYEKVDQVENQCDLIVDKVYQLYINQEKSFLTYTKEQIEFTKTHHLIHYQLRQLFYEVEYHFQKLSDNDQEEFINILYQYILQLSDDKKWLFHQHIPETDFSIEVLKEIDLSSILIYLSNVSPTYFFDQLTTLMMKYAEKLSMNIPLLNHEDISPAIRLFTSPYFITPNVLGGRALQMNYQHQAIKKRLMPYILMQITLTYLNDENSIDSPVLFLDEWKRRVEKYRQLEYQSVTLEMKHIEINEHIMECRKRIDEFIQQRNDIQEQLNIELHKLKSTLLFMDINELTISHNFEIHRDEYFLIQNKLNQLTMSKRDEILETSLIKQFANKLLNMSVTLDRYGKEKKIDELLGSLVMDILDSDSEFKRADRALIKQIQKKLKDIEMMVETENRIKNKYNMELMKINQQLQECSKNLNQLENDNYGIKEVVQSI